MDLLYKEEHCSCHNYEKDETSTIEIASIGKDKFWQAKSIDNKIVFVTKGRLRFIYGDYTGLSIAEGSIMLVPSGLKFKAEALEDSQITIFRIRIRIQQLCQTFSLERLRPYYTNKDDSVIPYYLRLDDRLMGYLTSLHLHIEDGLRCFNYFQLKLQELFFLFRGYYPKEELAAFFAPLLTADLSFSEAIYQNSSPMRTVSELADKMNYSLSGFQKRFKRVFGVSAHSWIIDKRQREILSDIHCTDKALKDISDKYGFSSPSHFNDFCKTHFGNPPGMLRKQVKESI